jgi:hypothetical protein
MPEGLLIFLDGLKWYLFGLETARLRFTENFGERGLNNHARFFI